MINKIINQVKNLKPIQDYYPLGNDTSTCPFCGMYILYLTDNLSDINHSEDCAYNLVIQLEKEDNKCLCKKNI